jgi:hypothetical protein
MSCSFAACQAITFLERGYASSVWRGAISRGASEIEPSPGDWIGCYFSDDIAFRCVVCIISLMVVAENVEKREIAVRSVPWWRLAFFCVVMFSLVLTLATRTFRGTTSHSIEVQSNSPQAMRQHMDRDAVRWAAPVAKVVVSQVPTFYARVAPTGPPLPTLRLEENLHNRPPPAC